MEAKSKGFKAVVFVLVAAIVVVGVLLLVKTIGSPTERVESNLPEGASIEDFEGADMREFTIDEGGNVTEADPEQE